MPHAPRTRTVAAALLVVVLGAAGCAQDEPAMPIGDPPGWEPTPTATAAPTAAPVKLDWQNTLRPGRDGSLPVEVRWVSQLGVPENFYVVGDVVHISDECLITLSVRTGDELGRACKPDGNGIFSDGGDEIGPAGPGRIRVYTWFNETLLVDTESHTVIESTTAGGERPEGFTPFPARLDTTYDVSFGGQARDRRGRLAWSIRTKNPLQDTLGPVRTPTGAIVVTSSGLMVALDYLSARPSR